MTDQHQTTTAPVEARPDPKRIWVYRGFRDNSRLIAEPHVLVAVGFDGARHELPLDLGKAEGHAPTRVVFTTTSHLGARGSVWREPRIVVASRDGAALLSMRADGYTPADVQRVAERARLRFSDRWFLSPEERDEALPLAPDAVQLDVTTRTVKVVLVAGLILATFFILAALVALIEH